MRFVGDRVVAVVAESPSIAEQACELITVDYEILPHVLDPEQAMKDCGVVIHDEPESTQIPDKNHNDEQGQILNPTLRQYRIPTAADMPAMEVILVEAADPYGTFGAKGVGEITTNCTAPAIANAIAHATGCRIRQLPMTPERIWQQLNKTSI